MKEHKGRLEAGGLRVGIVVSRFNELVSQRLLEGAVDALVRHGAVEADLTVAWVPGAFEIPVAARELAERGGVDAVVCVGAVIRGDTAHFDYVAGEAARGIAALHATTGVPAGFGVLTVDTLEQALDRAGGKHGNKGADAAVAAIEMANLLRELRRPRSAAEEAAS
ncbi:MAG: 6,7-dimethyl-8-ribityllumazine synthase [Candidatus Dormibacteraeota bacterium]|nr:6,7-dimethyl-8-ribityllumazine synthase [Candidatus Dormibacteraeota bacterium]